MRVVHLNQSAHFGRSDFHLTNLLSPVPLFCILLTRKIAKRAVGWVNSVQPECTVPLGKWDFRNFKPEFLLNGKCPSFRGETSSGIARRLLLSQPRHKEDSLQVISFSSGEPRYPGHLATKPSPHQRNRHQEIYILTP